MLPALRADGWITPEAERELAEAYRFLRTIEHRLQMIADEQTQRLPDDPERLAALRAVLRLSRTCALQQGAHRTALLRVEKHYARLFEEGAGPASEAGAASSSPASTDDPETLKTLRRSAFGDPAAVAETVRGWHFGRRPAVTSPRAREVLTELVPALLEAFGGTRRSRRRARGLRHALWAGCRRPSSCSRS